MADPTDGAPETPTPSPSPTAPPCRHLRSKGMYVYTDAASLEGATDPDGTIFWCQETLKDIGPDDGFVGREDCRDAARGCHEAD